MVYVGDVADILIEVGELESYGNVYEAGTGIGLSVKSIAEKVLEISGSVSELKFVPMRQGENDHSKVIAKNPYPYDYTDFNSALERTIEWYRDQNKNQY
jgi:UDP-glucose 4-epimerase